jgi:hypothetical protein
MGQLFGCFPKVFHADAVVVDIYPLRTLDQRLLSFGGGCRTRSLEICADDWYFGMHRRALQGRHREWRRVGRAGCPAAALLLADEILFIYFYHLFCYEPEWRITTWLGTRTACYRSAVM